MVSDIGELVAVRGRVLVCVLKRQGIDTGAVQKDGAKNQASEYLRAMSSSIALQSLVLAEGKAGAGGITTSCAVGWTPRVVQPSETTPGHRQRSHKGAVGDQKGQRPDV